jgi:hypothetical protein
VFVPHDYCFGVYQVSSAGDQDVGCWTRPR